MSSALSRIPTAVVQGTITPNTNITAPLGTWYMWQPSTTQAEYWVKTTQTVAGVADNTGWVRLGIGSVLGNDCLNAGNVAMGASINDWAPPGYGGQTVIRITNSSAGGTVVTGIDLGVYQVLGKILTIQQGGANNITYTNMSGLSLPNNQLETSGSALGGAGIHKPITYQYLLIGAVPAPRWVQIA